MSFIIRSFLIFILFFNYTQAQENRLYFDYATLLEIDYGQDRAHAKSNFENYLLSSPLECETDCNLFSIASTQRFPSLNKDLYLSIFPLILKNADNEIFIKKALFVLSTINDCSAWGDVTNAQIVAQLFIKEVNKRLDKNERNINYSYQGNGIDQLKLLQLNIAKFERVCNRRLELKFKY